MKVLIALVGLFFFSESHATELRKVCYGNSGAYVANVKFKLKEAETNRLIREDEYRRIWAGDRKCIDYFPGEEGDPRRELVEVRVERYMFLGNATLRHTCTEVIDYGSVIIWSNGTTTNAKCVIERF